MDGIIEEQLSNLPTGPGVYRFLDDHRNLLYVGKAKNLRKRVRSYFTKHHKGARLRALVKKITKIEFTVVQSEHEALLLENNLIKSQQPKYNIALKDDKTYPYICIKNEPYPRVFFTRKRIDDGSTYFGPYTSVTVVRQVLRVITTLFPLRTCKLKLTQENIQAKKFSVCLEYHIGNCLGPCEGLQSEAEYNHNIEQIKLILNGKTKPVLGYLKQKMNEASEAFRFEEAEAYKQRIEALAIYREKSRIDNTHLGHADVYHAMEVENRFFVYYMKIFDGSVIACRNIEAKEGVATSLIDVLERAIAEHSIATDNPPDEVILPVDLPIEGLPVTVPKIGAKKKLLDMAWRNLMARKKHYIEIKESRKQKANRKAVLETLQQDLRLNQLPRHIECFDNSNIQGTSPVASCVVFKDGKPAKKEYRTFHIKTVEGPDDFASMREVVYRRYKRLLEENENLPQLIVIDGGKGQLSSALSSLDKLGIRNKVTVVGIAKRLEEIYFPGDSFPLHINKKSPSLKLLQQLRNEAHRFAINFHRKTRSKNAFTSELDNIPGIGEKTRNQLLNQFGSLAKIKRAPLKELALAVGQHKAKLIKKYFQD